MDNTHIPPTQAQHKEMHAQSKAVATVDYAQHGPTLDADGSHASRCMCDVCCPPQPNVEPLAHVCCDTTLSASDVYAKRMAARLASTKHPKHNLYTKIEHGVVTLTWTGMREITVAYFKNSGTMSKTESFDTDQETQANEYHQFLVDGLNSIKVEEVNDAKSSIAFLDQNHLSYESTSANGPKAREVLAIRETISAKRVTEI